MKALDEASLVEFAKTVELTASQLLEGFHVSRRGGEGLEFHSLLSYSPGEDVRRIDWRRYASSDRLFVKKFEREEKSNWILAIDRSPSMNYGAKRDWASRWAGVIIFLAQIWGDRWQLVPHWTNEVKGAFEALTMATDGFKPELNPTIESQATGRLIVLSDFFWEREFLEYSLKNWQADFKSVHCVQILEPQEASFDFKETIEFRDLESSDRLILDGQAVKKRYLVELTNLQRMIQSALVEPSTWTSVRSSGESIELQIQKFFEVLWAS